MFARFAQGFQRRLLVLLVCCGWGCFLVVVVVVVVVVVAFLVVFWLWLWLWSWWGGAGAVAVAGIFQVSFETLLSLWAGACVWATLHKRGEHVFVKMLPCYVCILFGLARRSQQQQELPQELPQELARELPPELPQELKQVGTRTHATWTPALLWRSVSSWMPQVWHVFNPLGYNAHDSTCSKTYIAQQWYSAQPKTYQQKPLWVQLLCAANSVPQQHNAQAQRTEHDRKAPALLEQKYKALKIEFKCLQANMPALWNEFCSHNASTTHCNRMQGIARIWEATKAWVGTSRSIAKLTAEYRGCSSASLVCNTLGETKKCVQCTLNTMIRIITMIAMITIHDDYKANRFQTHYFVWDACTTSSQNASFWAPKGKPESRWTAQAKSHNGVPMSWLCDWRRDSTNTVFYVPLQQNIFKPWPHRHSMKIHETVALEYRSQFGQDQEWPCGIHTVKSWHATVPSCSCHLASRWWRSARTKPSTRCSTRWWFDCRIASRTSLETLKPAPHIVINHTMSRAPGAAHHFDVIHFISFILLHSHTRVFSFAVFPCCFCGKARSQQGMQ